jgi:hypothetical protein
MCISCLKHHRELPIAFLALLKNCEHSPGSFRTVISFGTAVCKSYATFEQQLNTIAKGLGKYGKIRSPFVLNIYHAFKHVNDIPKKY